MSAHTPIAPAARAAVHCDVLLAQQAPEHDLLGSFTGLGEAVAERFASELYAVTGGTAPSFTVADASTVLSSALSESIGPVAGNLLIPVGGQGGWLLASFAVQPLMDQIDRMFGGGGGSSEAKIPAAMPRSVELLLARLEKGLCAALAGSLAAEHRSSVGTPRLDPSLRTLALFPAGAEVAAVKLEFSVTGAAPITLLLACRLATLARLAPMLVSADGSDAPPRSVIEAPFTEIRLPLRAVLVDMILPVRKLAGLEVGMVLPLAVARSVPLMAGNQNIAFGAVGELDDRVALQIERTLIGGETQ